MVGTTALVATRLVLVGTGTGVGKTHVACALLRTWSALGEDAIGLKPIETGVDAPRLGTRASEGAAAASPALTPASSNHPAPPSSDHPLPESPVPREGSHLPGGALVARVQPTDFERLAEAVAAGSEGADDHVPPASRSDSSGARGRVEVAPFHVKHPAGSASEMAASATTFHVKRPLYAFPDPISPHLAAHRAGTRIDLAAIRRWVLEHSRKLTLVETAGGLFSPISDSMTNLDLARALLPARLLLVAPDRLGVLHDVAATVGFARASGWSINGLVLSAPDSPDASTGHNAPAIEAIGLARVVASFPRAHEADAESRAAAEKVIAWLARSDDA